MKNNQELKSALNSYKEFLTATMDDLKDKNNLNAEQTSMIIAEGIKAAISGSVQLVKVEKDNELTDLKKATEKKNKDLITAQESETKAATTRNNNESAKNVTLLDKRITYVASQDAEVKAATTRNNSESTKRIALWDKDIVLKTNNATLLNSQDAEVKAAKIRKDELHTKSIAKATIENYILENTKAYKIQQSQYTTLKVNNEALLIGEEKTQLINSVADNKKIKTLQVLGQTFGTGLAGSLVVPASGWGVMFSIANELSGFNGSINPDDVKLIENV